jgi:hypothetical protein
MIFRRIGVRAEIRTQNPVLSNTRLAKIVPQAISADTFHNRLKGTKPHSVAHENTRILTAEEEKALENYIVQLDEWGHPLKT